MTKQKSNLIKEPEAESFVKKGLANARSLATETAYLSISINPPEWKSRKVDFSNQNVFEAINAFATSGNKNHTFTNIDFSGSNFTNADFTFFASAEDEKIGKLSGMVLQGCKFNDCDFDGAILAYCDLRWSDFTGAKGLDNITIAEYVGTNPIVGSTVNTFECKGLS